MSTYDDDARVDPYELVERVFPYDGPYSAEFTTAAASMVGRLGRYLNNATQKRGGLPHAATAGQVVSEVRAAVAGYEQLLTQLARFLQHTAATDVSLYDDRYDRPGADTARRAAAALVEAVTVVRTLGEALSEPDRLASHLGSTR